MKILEIDPQNSVAYESLAFARAKLGELDEPLKALQESILYLPGDVRA